MSVNVNVLDVMRNVIESYPMFAAVDGIAYSRADMVIARAIMSELADAVEAAYGDIYESHEACTLPCVTCRIRTALAMFRGAA